jgi:hypothetical protein
MPQLCQESRLIIEPGRPVSTRRENGARKTIYISEEPITH